MKFRFNEINPLKYLFTYALLCICIFSYSQEKKPDSTALDKQVEMLNTDLNRLTRNYNTTYYKLDNFIKAYNNEIHSQQYKNDSLFEQVLLLHNEITRLKREINKLYRSTQTLNNRDIAETQRINTNLLIIYIALGIIFMVSIVFLMINRLKFRKQNDALNKRLKELIRKTEENGLSIKHEILTKLEEEINKLHKTDEKNKKELMHKLSEARESIESRFREINNQLEDRFK